jgi:cell division protein FtsB
MIQINLLPPEYRARTGTPVARFVAIVVGVVLLASATGAYAYTHFIELAKVRELKAAREEEAKGKETQRDRSLALQAEIDAYERRRAAIQTINRSRTLWSRKLDQFFDIVTNQETQEAYNVWLEELEVPPQLAAAARRSAPTLRKGAPQDGGQFKFAGFMAMEAESEGPAQSSAFYKALTGDPDNTGTPTTFFSDFLRINNPGMKIEAQRSAGDEELVPPVVGTFKYDLTLRPLEAPAKPAAPPAGGAKKR